MTTRPHTALQTRLAAFALSLLVTAAMLAGVGVVADAQHAGAQFALASAHARTHG